MPDTNCEVANAIAERTRRSIEALGIRHRGLDDGHVTASLGVTCGKTSQESLEDLLKAADTALYEAKRAGRNTVSVARIHARESQ